MSKRFKIILNWSWEKYILNEFIIVEEKSISYGGSFLSFFEEEKQQWKKWLCTKTETFQPVLFENLEFEPYQDEYSVDKILQNIPKAIIEDPFLEISKFIFWIFFLIKVRDWIVDGK